MTTAEGNRTSLPATVGQPNRIATFLGERRIMSSNRSALDALAQEGILMTEETLLRETRKVQSMATAPLQPRRKG